MIVHAQADPTAESDEATLLEIDTSSTIVSPIADAHAQVAAVLPPASDSSQKANWYGDVLAYAGIDGWRHGGSAYVGGEWKASPQSPIIVRIFGADGIDDFRTGAMTYRSETARASLLPGYHVQSGKLDIKLFLGGDFMLRTPLRGANEAPLRIFGARTSLDLWWEPAQDWMLSASASATTIEHGLSGRLASGWRLPLAWIGPEILATHDIYNTQWRAGAHLSGFKIGPTEWSVAGGYAGDSFGRGGAYGRLGITLRP